MLDCGYSKDVLRYVPDNISLGWHSALEPISGAIEEAENYLGLKFGVERTVTLRNATPAEEDERADWRP